MSTIMEKDIHATQEEIAMDEKEGKTIKAITGSEAFAEAYEKEPPHYFNAASIYLYYCCFVAFCCSTANGYDGSLLNNLFINPVWKDFFHGSNAGIWAGIVTSLYQIGSVSALPAVGPVIDNLGRKGGMFTGAAIIIIGAVIQGCTVRIDNYLTATYVFGAGRFFLGFGVAIAASAGPMYVVEVVQPALRGRAGGLYNTFWFVGSIVASGAGRGGLNMAGNKSWLIPVWLQLLFAGIIVTSIWIMPESPRWNYVHGKQQACKDFLVKYHGNGNPDSVWVALQLHEYEEHLELDGSDKRWWDYRALFRDRASRYRIGVNVMVSLWGQWAGNAVLSYYLSAVLDTVGITDKFDQQNIALGIACASFVVAVIGASLTDRLGRRFLLLFGMTGCATIWVGVTVASALFAQSNKTNTSAAKATQALIYIFSIIYSFSITPLQALYPVEVLSFEMRAKGMAFSNLAVAAGGLLNQFAWPVSLEKIGWRTYIIFSIWCFIQAGTIYLYCPETKNQTLEELDEIFKSKNPRKASTQKKKIALDEYANVVHVL
ncbi:sugar transporter-like protein 40 [Elsinoe australis]|uniref:High-affinity glucose transporter n=1 Tax=Elsinoe australis TaxID=40998 RepID=A0A2P7ZU68_9PEZI|nr:High-affinity glucose transporter [Elsinoe australis]TKX19089.1 sugar transporter-like protein 40 [Elsinoe australis]